MPRVSKLLTEEQKAIAEKNDIPLVTVYKRLDRDWDIEKAITKPTRKIKNVKREDGLFVDAGRGERRQFSLPKEWDEELERAIAESQMGESELLEIAVIDWLKMKKKQAKK